MIGLPIKFSMVLMTTWPIAGFYLRPFAVKPNLSELALV